MNKNSTWTKEGIAHARIIIFNNRGIEFEKIRKFEEAIACYRQALAVDQNNVNSLNLLEKAQTRLSIKELTSEFEKIVCYSNFKIMWEPFLYSKINENDRKLTNLWLSNSEEKISYHKAKMLSARFAERIAMKFYESIGHKVSDISITQLSAESQDWKSYDILLDDKVAIDVKNSRNSVSSQVRYVEYCIPRFKETRYGDQVKIAGVMSPYLTLEHLNKPLEIHFPAKPITYLGETSELIIKNMSAHFTSNNLLVKINNNNILPPWVFEYPNRYYENRNIQIMKLKYLIENNHLNTAFSKISLIEPFDIVPIVLMTQIRYKMINISFENALEKWELDFCDKVISQEKITMPVVFFIFTKPFC